MGTLLFFSYLPSTAYSPKGLAGTEEQSFKPDAGFIIRAIIR